MANYAKKNEKNEKEVKEPGRNESITKELILVGEDHLRIILEDVGQPTTTCLESNQEVDESGRNESLTKELTRVTDELRPDRLEVAETSSITCSDDNTESNDPCKNVRHSEGSSELLVEHQLDRLESSGQQTIPRAADSLNLLVSGLALTETGKNKPWNKRSVLCNQKNKGKYNHTQDQCQYLHGEECEICLKPVLHPFRKGQRDIHLLKCRARHTWEAERLEASRSVQCHVCLDIVLEKEAEADRRFALLEGCNHSCCWSCYESMKKLHDPNMTFENWSRCSLCRQPYAFAVSSKFVVADDQNRSRILSEFRKACRRKLCYKFRQTGTCDAGALCIFRHRGQVRNRFDLPDITFRDINDNDNSDDENNSDDHDNNDDDDSTVSSTTTATSAARLQRRLQHDYIAEYERILRWSNASNYDFYSTDIYRNFLGIE